MAQSASAADYANYPLAMPPPGVIPNFVNPQSRSPELHAGMAFCLAVASIFVLLRICGKAFITHTWGWEDVTCLLGYAFIVIHDAISFTIAGPGLGKLLGVHLWDVQVKDLNKEYLQRTNAAVNLYAGGALFVKLSLFLLYMRLFRPNDLTRRLIIVGAVACAIFYPVCIILNCALCIPSPLGPNDEATWNTQTAQCETAQSRVAFAQGIFGTLSDIYLLVIPIQMVMRLHLPLQRKLGVSAVFLTGIIAIACSIGSLACRSISLTDFDLTWNSVSIFIFSNAEVCAGIICVTAPLLPSMLSSASAKTKLFKVPSSLRHFVQRWSTGRSGSSRRPFVGGRGSRQDGKYVLSQSEEEFSVKLANGFGSGPEVRSGGRTYRIEVIRPQAPMGTEWV